MRSAWLFARGNSPLLRAPRASLRPTLTKQLGVEALTVSLIGSTVSFSAWLTLTKQLKGRSVDGPLNWKYCIVFGLTDINKTAWGQGVYGLLNWKYCIVFGLSIRHLFHSQSQTLFTNRERPSTQPSVAKPTPTRHETNPKMGGGSCKYLLSIFNIQTNTVKTRT